MKEIFVTLSIVVLLWLVIILSGCTEYRFRFVPVQQNQANCIKQFPDGTTILSICELKKPSQDVNI